MKPSTMSRAFGKWWDRRKVVGGNRFEADAGWKAGALWALDQAIERFEDGLTGREENHAKDDERRLCMDELRVLAGEIMRETSRS